MDEPRIPVGAKPKSLMDSAFFRIYRESGAAAEEALSLFNQSVAERKAINATLPYFYLAWTAFLAVVLIQGMVPAWAAALLTLVFPLIRASALRYSQRTYEQAERLRAGTPE